MWRRLAWGQRGVNRHIARGVTVCGAVFGTGSRHDACGGSRGKYKRPRFYGGDRLREPPKYVRQTLRFVTAAMPHVTLSITTPAIRPDQPSPRLRRTSRKFSLLQSLPKIFRNATRNFVINEIPRRQKSHSRDRHPDGRTDQSLFFMWSFRIRGEFWPIRRKI